MTLTNSHTSQIDKLIKTHNPFAGRTVVRPAHIWGKSFPDVPSINAHASNAVLDAVNKINHGERDTVGITITAEKGLGKSHIISRIRHQLQKENKTLFIYMNRYDDLNQIKYQFLQSVTSSLRVIGNKKVMQWQEIAAALINESRQGSYTPQQYMDEFPKWLEKHSHKVVDKLTEIILQAKPEITNPYLVKAIIWTLSSAHSNYANFWLSGLELTQGQADAMGLPNPKIENRDADALSNVRQILNIISNYKIPVICFDELDNTEVADNGFTSAQIIASLTKDLYTTLKTGVLLLVMYPETWNNQIRSLPQAEAVMDRLVSEEIDRQPINLQYLNADNVVALVQQWLKDFYDTHQVIPPHPLYPFDENTLRKLGKGKPTLRAVLKWCADNIDLEPIHPVEPYYQQELKNIKSSINDLFEDEVAIANALWLGFMSLQGETVEGVTIEKIEEINDPHINLKIFGNQGKVKIGIDVLQKSGGVGVLASLKRLVDYHKFGLTRGCLVRSKQIGAGAIQARKCLDQLLNELGGEWVGLLEEDIIPLLAMWFVYYESEDYELTKEEILDFMQQNQLAIKNPLLREILSDPSGEEPDDLTDDDLPITTPKNVENVTQNINNNLDEINENINQNIKKSIDELAKEIDNLSLTNF